MIVRIRQKKSANTGKLLKENEELSEKIKKIKLKVSKLASEIDHYKDLEIEMATNEAELKRKGQKLFQKEKEELIATYEVKQDNLRGEIEELHKKLEQKTAEEGGRSGLKSLFGDDYAEINIADYKQASNAQQDDEEEEESDDGYLDDEIDDESQGLNGNKKQSKEDVPDANIKYLHKHLHRHDHKHIHDHRHTHIHDQRGKEPITYTHTHTIAHTITHTMTQFKIKKNTFGSL